MRIFLSTLCKVLLGRERHPAFRGVGPGKSYWPGDAFRVLGVFLGLCWGGRAHPIGAWGGGGVAPPERAFAHASALTNLLHPDFSRLALS